MRAPLALLLLSLPAIAAAQERVPVRTGDHPGHGRLVANWSQAVPYRLEEAPGRAVLHFGAPAAFDLAGARRLPRNIAGIATTSTTVEVALRPGARLRHYRLGNVVVLDVLDPDPAARPATPPPTTVDAPAAPVPASMPTTPPVATAPRQVPVGVLQGARFGITIPASEGVGAALLRRGDTWVLVLDAPLPLDLSALRGRPGFSSAEMSSGLDHTVLRFPVSAMPAPRLRREATAWLLDAPDAAAASRSIRPEAEAGSSPRILLRAARPSQVVAIGDPETGAALLVGTVREGGQAMPLGRRMAQLDLLPTLLGIAVLPRADTVSVRVMPDRFAVTGAPGGALALGTDHRAADADALGMSRLFDLPPEALPALQERARAAVAAAASAAPLARGAARIEAAQALLALGLVQEAQAMADLAIREDPRVAADGRARALHGAAALLAGRLAETRGLEGEGPDRTDEQGLWQGLLAASSQSGQGAGAIAAGLPLLLGYPAPLRARLLPLAAEALVRGGEVAAARRLLNGREADPSLALARALLLEAEGSVEAALAAYDALDAGRDRRARALALRRAAELRLAIGRHDANGAATALERTLSAWRGDAGEGELRLRIAQLQRQAGRPLSAFDGLREAELLLPDLTPRLRQEGGMALAEALRTEAPFAAVALFDAHADRLPPGAATEEALGVLAERLAALDLTDRAAAVLRRAASSSGSPEARARLGAREAALALAGQDASGAQSALRASAAANLPASLVQERALLEARALARLGEADRAVEHFRAAGTAGAPELAELLAARRDWAGAATVLGQILRAAPLPPGTVAAPSRQDVIVRVAAFLAHAGDEAGLAALRQAHAAEMEGGGLAEPFALLTNGRLSGMAELGRVSRDVELARALPSRLEELRTVPMAAR